MFKDLDFTYFDNIFRDYMYTLGFDYGIREDIEHNIYSEIQEYKVKDLSFELIMNIISQHIKQAILQHYPSVKEEDIVIEFNKLYINGIELENILDWNMTYFLLGLKDKKFEQKYNKFIKDYNLDLDDISDILSQVESFDGKRFYGFVDCTVNELLDKVISLYLSELKERK